MIEEDWIIKWKFLIDKISYLIEKNGRKMVIFNVEAQIDSKRQFEQYRKTCESLKDRFEAVVTTSLPGEERIFWPYQDVQFYVKDDVERIQSTGNLEVIQEIFNLDL